MIFKSKENQCLLQILRILNKKPRTYGWMFKETKVSHTTLQSVLKYLIEGKFVKKDCRDYEINDKGKWLFEKLHELNDFLI